MGLPGQLSDQEKAAALDDLMRSFREEWFDVDGTWLTIDGSAIVSGETSRVLRILRRETRA